MNQIMLKYHHRVCIHFSQVIHVLNLEMCYIYRAWAKQQRPAYDGHSWVFNALDRSPENNKLLAILHLH